MADALLNIAHTIPRSAVNGPGERFVLWVQGCTLGCPGCWNPETWSRKPQRIVHALDLADEILTTTAIEGITLTGGEPFQQAAQLTPLVSRVRAVGLSVVVFTGYDLEELVTEEQQTLLLLCDVVVAGRYRKRQRSQEFGWRGSSNQQVHFLTSRYTPAAIPIASECEIHIAPSGSLTLTGFPPVGLDS